MKNKKIGVVMGGVSTEREVSLNTGRAILNALREKGYNAVSIDLEPEHFVEQLKSAGIDIVFNALHGKFGEDGCIQGMLEMLGIPYTGSGVLASAITMDKAVSKRLFLSANLPTPHSRIYSKIAFEKIEQDINAQFNLPIVIKASTQGSSIGVYIINDASKIRNAVSEAFTYSNQIVVEEFIEGKEITAAVYGKEEIHALPLIEIVPHSGRYDYHSKYTKGATEYLCPAPLDEHTTHKIQQIALKAYKLLGCSGVARVDFMLDKDNNPYVLEINTIPGMTETSLVPKAAAKAGIDFPNLCEMILLMAVE